MNKSLLLFQPGSFNSLHCTITMDEAFDFNEDIHTKLSISTESSPSTILKHHRDLVYIEPTSSFKDPLSREDLVTNLFSTSSVNNILFIPEPLLALYSHGLDTGIVIDCGHSGSRACFVSKGVVVPQSIFESSCGGEMVTNSLRDLCASQETSVDFWTKIKHEHCFVSKSGISVDNYQRVVFETNPNSCRQFFKISKEAYQSSECLFSGDHSVTSLVGNVLNFINSLPELDLDLIPIVVIGGSSALFGFSRRLSYELTGSSLPQPMKPGVSERGRYHIRVIVGELEEQALVAFKGIGNILNFIQNRDLFVSRVEFEKYGKGIIHVKSF
ncbi:hypothetical protein GEMRC1_013815 [Eukaryota sp. GEM-RC1]